MFEFVREDLTPIDELVAQLRPEDLLEDGRSADEESVTFVTAEYGHCEFCCDDCNPDSDGGGGEDDDDDDDYDEEENEDDDDEENDESVIEY